jgi:putative redox protein
MIVTHLTQSFLSERSSLQLRAFFGRQYRLCMTTITADITAGAVVELRNGRHTWTADEPLELNGTDAGPNPYELLLGALGACTCTCITISCYCQRKGWTLHSVSAKYTYDKIHAGDCAHCEDDAHGMLHNVTSEIYMDGDFDDEQRARFEDIAKKCPIHRTFEAGLVFDETVTF